MQRRLCFSLLILLVILQSCAAQTVLDISRKKAAGMLREGDIRFIVDADSSRLGELARIDISAPFYAALLVEKAGHTEHAAALLGLGLRSPATKIASAKKLIPADPNRYFDEFLKDSSIAEGTGWEKVFQLAAEAAQYTEIDAASLVFDHLGRYFYDEKPDAAYRWLFKRVKPVFSGDLAPEINIIDGRIAISGRSYREALDFFKKSGRFTTGPDAEKSVFLQNIELTNDLGLAFQYTAPEQGISLFTGWNERIKNSAGFLEARYILLYFAGRMARSAKKPKDAIAFFEEALAFAPDGEQKDACIWYIFDTAYGEKPENTCPFIEKYAPLWKNADYFNDIFERISSWAVKKRQFIVMEGIFDDISRYASAESAAQYAYILGRATELGFLRGKDGGQTSGNYYAIAYETMETSKITLPVLYYHTLSAKRLNRNIGLDAPDVTKNPKREGGVTGAELDFLSGFFKFGCAEFAWPFIREYFDKLDFTSLKAFAEALYEAEQWQPLINLTIRCRESAGFSPDRRDWELSFPQGYKKFIEDYAAEAEIEPSLLFALVRQESLFNAGVHSRTGAAGLTQLMEATAGEVAATLAARGGPDYRGADGTVDLLNPEINLHLGALYYKQLLDRLQNNENALLAYNGGITRIRRWRAAEAELPDDLFLESVEYRETREYGRAVIAGQTMYNYLRQRQPRN